MSQNTNIPIPPTIQIQPQNIKSRQNGIADSLRFSYDFDSRSSLAYSQDGRQIDFQFQQFPQYQFKADKYKDKDQDDNDKNQTMDISGANRRLQIFQKYRHKNQNEQVENKDNIIDSFDKIFNIKEQKPNTNINTNKIGFKRKQNNQQPILQAISQTKKIEQNITVPQNKQINQINKNSQKNTNTFVLQNKQKIEQQPITSINSKNIQSKQIQVNKSKNQDSINININNNNNSQQNNLDNINTSFDSISSINSNNTNQFIITPRNDGKNQNTLTNWLNILNDTDKDKKNTIQKPITPTTPKTQIIQKIQMPIHKDPTQKAEIQNLQTKIHDFLSGSNKSIQITNYLQGSSTIINHINYNNTLNENNLSQSNVSVTQNYTPVLPQQSPTITINNKNIPHLQIPQNQSNQSDYTIKPLTPTNFKQKTSLNQMIQLNNRLGNPIFEQQSRIAPFLRKIRKMNSIYPNFNHPSVNLSHQAKFCNILACIFEQAFNFLQKMTNKAIDRRKQPKYFPSQFASLSYFINSQWQKQRYRQWQLLNSTLKPRTNFIQNQIDQVKIRGALINYKQVILYYKQRKIDLTNQQGIKSYFRIRQKFWSLQRNMRSISQDIYRLFQQTQYPQFYYDYLKVLRSPLPAKNDEQTIQHHQQILNNLIINRQWMQPLSCSQVGQAVKIKLERQLKFLCPF